MKLLDTFSADLRAKLTAPEFATLLDQAERLHENIPHGAVVAFVTETLEAAGGEPGALGWKLAAAAEANRLLVLDADEFDL